MSGTVPPPPPGSDGRPPSVPPSSPAAGVRRVRSAYQRPAVVAPEAVVPLQQVTAPAPATPPAGAATVHAPVPPPPDAAPAPAPQATQQFAPAAAPAQQAASYPPAPTAGPGYPTQTAHPTQAGYPAQGYSTQGYPTQGYPAQAPRPAAVPPATAATQVQQPVPAAPPAGAQPPAGYAASSAAAPPPPPPERRPRRLSAGWIAFIAVDVVLIAMAAVFAVQIFNSSSPTATKAGGDTVATTPAPSASEEPAEPMQGEVLARFAAPSKNITCSVYADGVSCGIAQLNQQPAPTEGCEGTRGYVVTVDAEGTVDQPCVPASEQPKAAGGDVDVLEYGDSITEGDFTCASDETGMSCTHDPTGKGFSLARAGIGTS